MEVYFGASKLIKNKRNSIELSLNSAFFVKLTQLAQVDRTSDASQCIERTRTALWHI